MAKKTKRYKVSEGEKIRGVKDGDVVRIYQAGEILPDSYVIHQTYIDQGIVEVVNA